MKMELKKNRSTLDVQQNKNDKRKLDKAISSEMESKSTYLTPLKNMSESCFSVESKSSIVKKRKSKTSDHTESFDSGQNHTKLNKKESPLKKHKKSLSIDGDDVYKPGMLSDLLQKQKYGCLILPWKSSFGSRQLQDSLSSGKEGMSTKPNIKINPLFDMSKVDEGSIVSKDSKTFTIFVGNLPPEITINQVKKIFKKFGNSISKIKIKSDERRNTKLFASTNQNISSTNKHATVKFSSQESYETALKMNGKMYNGHHLRITGADGSTSSDPKKSVFVGNLASGISDDALWKTFENCGEISSVRVIRDTLNKKGIFGYVNFQTAESVEAALRLDGVSVLDREIRVCRINKNMGSLSDSVTVKRNRKKRRKLNLNNSNDNVQVLGKKKRNLGKSSTEDLQGETEPNTSLKRKKKKKKKTADEHGENELCT